VSGGGRGKARSRKRAPGGDRSRKRAPEAVGGVIRSLFERWGIEDRVARARAANEWSEVVGDRIARATSNPRVSGKTLFVEVASSAWMSELNMMRHRLLRKLNEGKEERARIEKIVFLQADGRRGEG